MPDGVIVALTALTFGAHTQHALIVCVVISAFARGIHLCGDCHGSGGRSNTAPPALSIHAPHPIRRRYSFQPKPYVLPLSLHTVLRDCERNRCSRLLKEPIVHCNQQSMTCNSVVGYSTVANQRCPLKLICIFRHKINLRSKSPFFYEVFDFWNRLFPQSTLLAKWTF
eukprot:scaffold90114_cov31-Attheya_sp.AAC.4